MKRQTNTSKRPRIVALALCASLCGGAAFGQGGPDGQDGPGENRPPPRLPPVIQALDTNHDGIIDANEIANAAQSLKTLLKSGSTSLTIEDLLGPPPHGRRPQGRGQQQGQQQKQQQGQGQGNGGGPETQLANPNSQNGAPPQGGQGGDQGGPPGPPPDQNGPGGHRPPPSPLMEALDTNHDGILEADEIANAAQSLKKLENANGEITADQLRPPPPPNWQPPPNAPAQSGSNGQTGAPPPPPPPPQ